MPKGEQNRVQRIARVRRHPDQPRRGHHRGDALLGEVGAVVELVETRWRLDFAGEQHQVAVVDRRHAVDRRLDP